MSSVEKKLLLPDGQVLEYAVDRGKRRNIYISVKDGRVVLKLPMGADEARGTEFLLSKADWVLKSLEPKQSAAVQPDLFTEGTRFTLAGDSYTVCCESSERYFPPRFGDGRLTVSVFGSADRDGYTDQQVRKAIREKALEIITERFSELTALTGLYPKKVTVKKMTASWGRCSSGGSISININVIFYDLECIDYVIIHELCHLRHMDHSSEFWKLVAQYCPDHKRIRKKMR